MQQITECPACNRPIAFYDSLIGEVLRVLECPTCGWSRESSKQWGGPGRGQGRKAQWKTGDTKTIRVPIALADQVMEYARALDAGELPGRSPLPFASLGEVLEDLGVPAVPVVPAVPAVEPPAVESPARLQEAIALLGEALGLKANAGGAIKTKIREALKLLG